MNLRVLKKNQDNDINNDISNQKNIQKLIKKNDKLIKITGKNSIDKLTKTKSKREIMKNLQLNDEIFNYNIQLRYVNELFLYNKCQNDKIILREIKNKISGYKSQDKIKECYDKDFFISLNDVLELIVKSKLKCYYCKDKLFILYQTIRENKQWTLDRIDNGQGHNKKNCVIACLSCNIQRKTMDDNKFKFTKQMNIIKKL